MTLHELRARGFDQSRHIPFTKTYHVGCSQCQALTINGVPTHETGCSNATRECAGCSPRIPASQRYCVDCQ